MTIETTQRRIARQGGAVRAAGLVLGGSLLIAAAAQVSVGWPVPMSLQTLAVLVVGMSLGARLGALAVVAYLAEGAMGLPVFANGMSAPALAGPTAGFLFGFVGMAYLAGLAADMGLARRLVPAALCAAAISLLLYGPGLAWPALVMGKTLPELWGGWMAPFLLGDAIKAVLAAMIVCGGSALLGRLRG
ncbi:biotin transporter BioY [Roseovarius sp. SCSIO 43702]|uniref:biotin transporter BioY n=1 Tax=Roseovarius sp. SCSIO 43702 TaxID=2823043 RepID=UPI001C73B1F4|nr:biotin transporter BioY [Roseovarius sp. SCSIO 43702]QYX58438.1 biotin transporter BioY [Roseovarius sp. SCSIO 43702]